jgi:hypothetical protein
MIRLSKFTPDYLYSEIVDMRKSIYGLSGIVENELELNPLEPYLYFVTEVEIRLRSFIGKIMALFFVIALRKAKVKMVG